MQRWGSARSCFRAFHEAQARNPESLRDLRPVRCNRFVRSSVGTDPAGLKLSRVPGDSVIEIDGKALQHSFEDVASCNPLHLVSAYPARCHEPSSRCACGAEAELWPRIVLRNKLAVSGDSRRISTCVKLTIVISRACRFSIFPFGVGRQLDDGADHAKLDCVPIRCETWCRQGCCVQALEALTMSRRDLTGREWVAIQPPLPNRPRGVPRVGNRRALVDSSIMHARQHAEGEKRGGLPRV